MSPRLPAAYVDAYEATAMALHDTAECECLFPVVTHGPETEAVLSALGPYLRDPENREKAG